MHDYKKAQNLKFRYRREKYPELIIMTDEILIEFVV